MRTVCITGSAGGIGAATRTRLEEAGDRVIGVDVRDAVDAGRGVDECYARRAGLAAPAEPQHQWTVQGDPPATYGE